MVLAIAFVFVLIGAASAAGVYLAFGAIALAAGTILVLLATLTGLFAVSLFAAAPHDPLPRSA